MGNIGCARSALARDERRQPPVHGWGPRPVVATGISGDAAARLLPSGEHW